jgi:bacillithiol synthase
MSGVRVKAHCLPFSQIPHTTRLFADFLAYTPDAQRFYPRSPNFNDWAAEEAEKISHEPSRRQSVAAILDRQNRSWNASPQTLSNIERLRQGAAAVVTGQQVGLFGGPAFDLYKALTAVKLAADSTAAGVEAVPVFWLATYDHDLAEVNHIAFPGADATLQTLTTSSHSIAGAPVSAVTLGEEILPLLDQAAALLGENEATTLLREAYRPGETLGTAFARLFARLFADWGVIVLDASDPELHRVAAPIYRSAVERASELSRALLDRDAQLESAGYHQQVKVTSSSTLLFVLQNGVRTPIHSRGENEFTIGSEESAEKVSRQQLLDRIASHPEHFSPNVLLRPTVEDYLLPTLAYAGGAAEVAYFAQAAAVYELLLGRVTPILPRYSATVIEPKIARLLERFNLTVSDTFKGPEALRQKIAAQSVPEDLQSSFDAARNSLDSHLSEIKARLGKLDQTLADAAETSSSKIRHQFEKLYAQAARAEAEKNAVITRKADVLSQSLYPQKALQERGVGGMYFIARYGLSLLRDLYASIQPGCHDHQLIEI